MSSVQINKCQPEHEIDIDSQKCRFGWGTIAETYVPFIFRTSSKVKYIAVRILESHLIKAFISTLPNEITTLHRGLHCLVNADVTNAESQLLNEINFQHSDSMYGKDPFTTKDKIVPLEEAREFYNFLKFCYDRLILKTFQTKENTRAGFIRIDKDSEIPFIVLEDKRKYLPLFYFEEIAEHIPYTKHKVQGWNLAYVKFCCKVQGIKKELFSTDSCDVISFDEVSKNFPPNTSFEEFWPQKHSTIAMNNAATNSINAVSSPQNASRNHVTRQTRRNREETPYGDLNHNGTFMPGSNDPITKKMKN